MKQAIGVVAALALVANCVSWAAPPTDDLQTGIREVESGEFDAAILTLDGAARTLAEQGDRPKELARAYTYLAIAYLELGQEEAARTKVLEAVRTDPGLRLDPSRFPPKVVGFFERVTKEAGIAAPVSAPSPPGTASTTAAPEQKKSKALPIVLGVGGAAALAAVAVLASGGGADDNPPVTTPAGPTLSNVSATVTSAQRNANINCTQPVIVTLNVINRNAAAVSITGIRHTHRVVRGDCTAAQASTFSPLSASVGGSQTATVLNGPLFTGGSGCCTGPCSGGFCEFQSEFTVITGIGEIPAGLVNYGITFNGCTQCTATISAAADCATRLRPD